MRKTSDSSLRAFSTFDFRTKSRMGICEVSSLNSANGPAAKAKRYVLMGSVSGKCQKLFVPFRVTVSALVFDMTVQAVSVKTFSWNRAFKSGWSKQGKAVLASDGTKSV